MSPVTVEVTRPRTHSLFSVVDMGKSTRDMSVFYLKFTELLVRLRSIHNPVEVQESHNFSHL